MIYSNVQFATRSRSAALLFLVVVLWVTTRTVHAAETPPVFDLVLNQLYDVRLELEDEQSKELIVSAGKYLKMLRGAPWGETKDVPADYLEPLQYFVEKSEILISKHDQSNLKTLLAELVKQVEVMSETRQASGPGYSLGAYATEVNIIIRTVKQGVEVGGYRVCANPNCRGNKSPEKYIWNYTDPQNRPSRKVHPGIVSFWVVKDGLMVRSPEALPVGGKTQDTITLEIK